MLLTGNYDYRIVVLSLVIAIFASFMAFNVASQAAHTRVGIRKYVLLSSGSIALGGAIWAVHFLGMLAFDLCTPIVYEPTITFLSVLSGVVSAWAVLFLMTKNTQSFLQIIMGGIVMGLGITTMHYIGMQGMTMVPLLKFDPWLFALSIAVAICFSILSLWMKFSLHKVDKPKYHARMHTIGASIVMGGAIFSMHYIGMAASRFELPPGVEITTQSSPASVYLILTISFLTSVLIFLVLGISLLFKYKNVSQRAHDSEMMQRAITDTAVDTILTIDDKGIVKTANSAVEQLLGYTQDEIVGKPVSVIIPDNRKAIYDENFFRQKAVPLEQIIGTSREVQAVHKQGYLFSVRVGVGYTKVEGKAIFVALISDLRKRIEIENALRASEEKFRSFISNIPGIAYRCLNEKDWPIVFVSDAIYDMTGYRAEEFIKPGGQRSFSELFHPDDLETIYSIEGMDSEFSLEYRIVTKSNRVIWVIEHGVHVKDEDGNIIYIDGFLSDITARRKMEDELKTAKEKAEQAAAARSSFLANMSHEIRTPMNAIIGFSDLMLGEENFPQEYVSHIENINRSAHSLMHILNDVLDSAKLDKGKMALSYRNFVIRDEVNAVVATFSLEAEQKNIRLDVTIEDEVAEAYYGVPDRIRQVLNNLLGNAVKFTHKGGVRLSVFGDSSYVYFRIQDSGIGMSSQQVKQIFEPFTQADASMSRRFGGTGLGTTIAKQLVELMGGEICVQSEINIGSIFTFKLPLTPCIAPAQIDQVAPIELPPLHVLVVDDVDQNIELIDILLSRLGHSVSVSRNGQDALEKMKTLDIDVVLMDLQMPVLDGLDAARQRRAYEATHQLPALPIIALTSSVLIQDRRAAAQAGMEGFANKPVDIVSLTQEIARVLHINRVEDKDDSRHYWQANESADTRINTTDEVCCVNVLNAVSLWGDEQTHLRELGHFIKESDSTLSNIDVAVGTHNLDRLMSLMHALKGVAGNLCLDALSKVCERIEAQALNGIIEPSMVTELRKAFEDIDQWLLQMQPSNMMSLSCDDIKQLIEHLSALNECVKKNMLDNKHVSAIKQFAHGPYKTTITDILTNIDNFDFDHAFHRIEGFINQLNKEQKYARC